MIKKITFVLFLIGIFLSPVYAIDTEEVIFSGIPSVKISEGGTSRVVEDLKGAKATEAECMIVKTGDKYLWKTRKNTEMTQIQSGAFVTFVAMSGAGYVRIIPPDLKEAASLMDKTEKKYDYVEHMLIGLKSVAYYGKSRYIWCTNIYESASTFADSRFYKQLNFLEL